MMGPTVMGEVGDMLTMCQPEANMTMSFTPTVVITSFGSNSTISDELEANGVPGKYLRFEKIPYTFEDAAVKAKEIWEIYPNLVIHLGSHSADKTVSFEKQAFGDGYEGAPEGFVAGEDLKTEVDCASLAEQVGKKFEGVTIKSSEDAGRSLDGFLYISSLRENSVNTLLIKLPPLDEECTKETVSEIVREVIRIQFK